MSYILFATLGYCGYLIFIHHAGYCLGVGVAVLRRCQVGCNLVDLAEFIARTIFASLNGEYVDGVAVAGPFKFYVVGEIAFRGFEVEHSARFRTE